MTKFQEESESDKVDQPKLTVLMTAECREKIRGWIDSCPTECGGLGTILLGDDGSVLIDNVFIYKQLASGAYFRLCNRDRAKHEMELVRGTHPLLDDIALTAERPAEGVEAQAAWDLDLQTKKKEAGRALYGRMQFHWHSHVNMGVFWSGTDCEAAEDMLKMYSWAIMLVANKSGNVKVKLVSRKPRYIIDDLNLRVLDNQWDDVHQKCAEEVKELVLDYSTHTYDEDKDEVVKDTNRFVGKQWWNDKDRTGAERGFLPQRSSYQEGFEDDPHFNGASGGEFHVRCLHCGHENVLGMINCTKCNTSLLEPETIPHIPQG